MTDRHTTADAQRAAESHALGRRLRPAIVTIDGPAASGKSTIGFALAAALDYVYFDTGVMYRAVTRAALDRSVPIADEAAVTALAAEVLIDIAPPLADAHDGRQATVLVDGRDVTWTMRAPEVDRTVSVVAAYPGVRRVLVAQQRRIADRYGSGNGERPGIVMVGRDIGTVVAPHAPAKVYMDATPEERAQRRHRELLARGKTVGYDDVLRDILRRDEIDSHRATAPLRPADDALIVDTTALTPEGVVERVLAELATIVAETD